MSSLSDNNNNTNNKKNRTLHPFVKKLLCAVESECDPDSSSCDSNLFG